MLKRLLSSITAIAAGSMAVMFAQLTASEAFTSAPNSVFPLLDSNTRLDMVDYYNNGLSTPSSNSLNGQSAITSMTDKALTVKMTDSSTSQIIVLGDGADSVIGVISTVATPGLDSKISFFDNKWNPLPADRFFTVPSLKAWLSDEGKGNEAEVTMQVPFMLASYSYDPTTGTLTATNNLSTFLDSDIYSIISQYLRDKLVYTWNGKKFSPVK